MSSSGCGILMTVPNERLRAVAVLIREEWERGNFDPWPLADSVMERFTQRFPDLPPCDEDEVFAIAGQISMGEGDPSNGMFSKN